MVWTHNIAHICCTPRAERKRHTIWFFFSSLHWNMETQSFYAGTHSPNLRLMLASVCFHLNKSLTKHTWKTIWPFLRKKPSIKHWQARFKSLPELLNSYPKGVTENNSFLLLPSIYIAIPLSKLKTIVSQKLLFIVVKLLMPNNAITCDKKEWERWDMCRWND